MKKAFVFTEEPDEDGRVRKTIVLKETETDPVTQEEIETISTFIIISEVNGLLYKAFELDLEAEIPEEEFTDNHTIPVPVPNNKIIQLDIDDPENSE